MRLVISGINLGWAVWALVGGVYFLARRDVLGKDTVVMVFSHVAHGHNIIGFSLLACGLVSLLGICIHKFKLFAAILCAVWCMGMAVALQIAAPGVAQADVDTWFLLLCGFTCVMRWALLKLEPYVCSDIPEPPRVYP